MTTIWSIDELRNWFLGAFIVLTVVVLVAMGYMQSRQKRECMAFCIKTQQSGGSMERLLGCVCGQKLPSQ
jgi:hypothetical protein